MEKDGEVGIVWGTSVKLVERVMKAMDSWLWKSCTRSSGTNLRKYDFDKHLLQKIEFRQLCKYELRIFNITSPILSMCVRVCVHTHVQVYDKNGRLKSKVSAEFENWI